MNRQYFDKLSANHQRALVDAGKEVEANSLAAARANLAEIWKSADELGVKVYRPTEEEMKLWKANMDALYADVLKNTPQVLDDIKEIQKMKN